MNCAIFDVDNTLIKGMSGGIFLNFLFKKRKIKLRRRLKILYYLYLFKLKRLKESKIVELGVLSYKGLKLKDLKRLGEECFEKEIKALIYIQGIDKIREHVDKGDIILLASGSSNFIVEPIGEFLRAHDSISTRADTNNGFSWDKVLYPICYREGKKILVENYLKQKGINLENCSFYSDDVVDIPLFNEVGHPVAVNPTKRLEVIARDKRWEIQYWNKLYL